MKSKRDAALLVAALLTAALVSGCGGPRRSVPPFPGDQVDAGEPPVAGYWHGTTTQGVTEMLIRFYVAEDGEIQMLLVDWIACGEISLGMWYCEEWMRPEEDGTFFCPGYEDTFEGTIEGDLAYGTFSFPNNLTPLCDGTRYDVPSEWDWRAAPEE